MTLPQTRLTIRETAATVRVSVFTIERMFSRGHLSHGRMSCEVRIQCKDFGVCIAAHRTDTGRVDPSRNGAA